MVKEKMDADKGKEKMDANKGKEKMDADKGKAVEDASHELEKLMLCEKDVIPLFLQRPGTQERMIFPPGSYFASQYFGNEDAAAVNHAAPLVPALEAAAPLVPAPVATAPPPLVPAPVAPVAAAPPPVWIMVAELRTWSNNINITVKVIDVRYIPRRRMVETIVGDETGCIVLRTDRRDQNKRIKARQGRTITLRNARIKILDKSMRLMVARAEDIEDAADAEFNVQLDNNLSLIEWDRIVVEV